MPAARDPEAVRRADVAASRFAEEAHVRQIGVDELQAMLGDRDQQPLYVVDVRMPHEFAAGHIPGSLSCQGGQVVLRADEMIAIRGARIVAVCDGFARAAVAASWYAAMGYPHVFALAGGMHAWQAAGLPFDQRPQDQAIVGAEERVRDPADWTREAMVEYLEWEERLGDKYEAKPAEW